MASKATKLKKDIRRLNATIGSNMRTLNRGHSAMISMMADPHYPNCNVGSFKRYQIERVRRAKMLRFMCAQLREMQAELIALESKRTKRECTIPVADHTYMDYRAPQHSRTWR